LDLFKRARGDWVKKVKAAGVIPDLITTTIPVTSEAQDGDMDGDAGKEGGGKKKGRKDKSKKKWEGKNAKVEERGAGKSAIQLAREKFAAQDALKKEIKNSKGTGANSGGVRLRK